MGHPHGVLLTMLPWGGGLLEGEALRLQAGSPQPPLRAPPLPCRALPPPPAQQPDTVTMILTLSAHNLGTRNRSKWCHHSRLREWPHMAQSSLLAYIPSWILREARGPIGKVCLEEAQGPGSGKWLLSPAV